LFLFTISVETHFWASHQLVLPDGSKEPLHRHDWMVTAALSSERLNSMGLVMDFHRLKRMLDRTVAEFADKTLDQFDYFRGNGSSAEMVAKYIYEKVEQKLPKDVRLDYIRVIEEPGFSAKFSK
jgi:6-pyruvoyltetrahydropterin/6-carboxytetrahydropterin synthase